MIKRQRAILSAASCLCLLLGLGIGLNGCGQKSDLSEKEENSVESQMGDVQQGVEQNTDNAKQFHGNSGNSETGERARTIGTGARIRSEFAKRRTGQKWTAANV